MTEDRILFFASGDFAIETFESLLENGFNVVGLVTSSDKVKFHNYHISQVAERYGVPTYIVKNDVPMDEDGFFMDWLKRANADIFCVISFKKLPNKIIKMAKNVPLMYMLHSYHSYVVQHLSIGQLEWVTRKLV